MTSTGPILFDPSDAAAIEFDWTDLLEGATTLASVVHSVPSPLTKVSEATDVAAGLSTVRISGALHGGLYMVTAQATLSSGEVINRQHPVRGWDS